MALLPLWTERSDVTQRDMLDMGSLNDFMGDLYITPYTGAPYKRHRVLVSHVRECYVTTHHKFLAQSQKSEVTVRRTVVEREAILDLLETDRERREEIRELRAADRYSTAADYFNQVTTFQETAGPRRGPA
ncbi:hypothetical protein Tco_0347960 [Tanacetum coccineum]